MSQPTSISDGVSLTPITHRTAYFLASWIVINTVLFWTPLRGVVAYASHSDDASHIFLIPFVSFVILFLERSRVFRGMSHDVLTGTLMTALGAGIAILAWRSGAEPLTLYMLALVVLWIAGFAFAFGRSALYQGRFALLLLFLSVPLPELLLNRLIHWLQVGSAAVVATLFDAVGVPYLRAGFVFHMAHLNIEIAQECSGIRSSMAVFILALLAAHFYLRSGWKQALFVTCSLFVMILKNGVRIAVLTMLAIHVDPSFLFGRLHRDGGVVFFLLGLALLLPVLWLLGRNEGENLGTVEASKTQ